MRRPDFQLSIAIHIAAVLLLFVGSLTVLWRTGRSVFDRERRRELVVRNVALADNALAAGGAAGLSAIPEWPETLDPDDWDALDRWLSLQARPALAVLADGEGGYYIPSSNRYLGYASTAERRAGPIRPARRHSSEPPPRIFELVDSQVRDALERNRPLLARIDLSPDRLAIRTAPVWINGRKVAATWTVAQLREHDSLEVALRQYQIAVGLALGALVLALALSFGLAWKVRRQAAIQARLHNELRRSERLAALGKLLAGVAHEVRNPLAGIRSTAQLWQRGSLVADDDSIAGLVAEIDRLDGLVSRLLQFSRADALAMTPGDLNALVAEAAQLAKGQADDQGVTLETHLAADLPQSALSPAAILQVLRNLTANALQAMPKGGKLVLSTSTAQGRRWVVAEVRDTGSGLPENVRDHLFDPFFTTKPEGTGLGLAIAREITLAHRGELRAEPSHGEPGAVFTLSLPALQKRAERPLFSEASAVR